MTKKFSNLKFQPPSGLKMTRFFTSLKMDVTRNILDRVSFFSLFFSSDFIISFSFSYVYVRFINI